MTCAILPEQYTQATIAHEAPHRIDRWPPTFPKEGYPFDMHAAAPSHIMHHDAESKIEVMLEDLVTGLETISFILCSMGEQRAHRPYYPRAVMLAPPPEAAGIGVAASCSILPSKRPRVALPESSLQHRGAVPLMHTTLTQRLPLVRQRPCSFHFSGCNMSCYTKA